MRKKIPRFYSKKHKKTENREKNHVIKHLLEIKNSF